MQVADWTKQISAKWRAMSEEDKASYNRLAATDKIRYNQQAKLYRVCRACVCLCVPAFDVLNDVFEGVMRSIYLKSYFVFVCHRCILVFYSHYLLLNRCPTIVVRIETDQKDLNLPIFFGLVTSGMTYYYYLYTL